ncbi:MAG: hypothetical protein IJ242_12800 [Clostridia bacterium]|nr:hypothetical protein [Clostridia bacterium]
MSVYGNGLLKMADGHLYRQCAIGCSNAAECGNQNQDTGRCEWFGCFGVLSFSLTAL